MKKTVFTFAILLFVSMSIFASSAPSLLVNLDLSAQAIELFGVTSSQPTVTDDYTNATTLAAIGEQSVSLTPVANDKTKTSEATFWVWWYIYSSSKYEMYINFNPLTSGSEKINYDITSSVDGTPKTFKSSENVKVESNDTKIVDLSGTKVFFGSQSLTIPAFDRLKLKVDDEYVSTITISIKPV